MYMAWKLNTHRIFLLNVLNLGYAFLLSFFCNHQNLLFSTVSENSSIGTHPCKWDPLKKKFRMHTVRPKTGYFFTSVISSYTAYMVTKSQISPQQKLGSTWNFNSRFIRYLVTTKKNFRKIRACTSVQESKMCAHAFRI